MKQPSFIASALALLAGITTLATRGEPPVATYEAPLDIRQSADAKFAAEPVVRKDGTSWRIAFAVSAATDVEVAVLDAKGNVVRHLAAGLLGPHAPAPFQKGSLKQELVWDGKDDAGRESSGSGIQPHPRHPAPFFVRVRLGARPAMEKILGWDPLSMGPIRALTVGAGGEVYVVTTSWAGQGRTDLRVFDRNGKYLRTILPYPAATPAARTKSVGQIEIEGERIPVVFNGHAHSLSPLTVGLPRQNLAWNPKGYVVAASTPGTTYEHGLPRHLLAFHPQGGAPEGIPFVGPEIRPPTGLLWGHGEGDDPCFEHLAASPDGAWIYYAPTTFFSQHAVFRLAWNEDKGAGMEEGWFGFMHRPGSDDTHLNDPEGLAVDAQGRVYICDRGNNRVVIVSPDAQFVGQFPVDDPEQIAVHPKTGQIYVFSRQAPPGATPKDTGPMSMSEYRTWKAREAERKSRRPAAKPSHLAKYPAWSAARDGKPQPLATLGIDLNLMALDSESDPPRLWIAGKGGLTPVDDQGDKLVPGQPIPPGKGLVHPGYVVGDPARNRVLVYNMSSNYKIQALDLATGQNTRLLEGVSDFALAPDGSLYGTGRFNSGELVRFAPDGKPLPFPGSTNNAVKIGGLWIGNINLGARGIAVAPNGDVYVLRAAGEHGVQSRIDVFSRDGKRKKAALVDGLGIGDCGIGVDTQGNVYLGVNVRPKDRLFPKEFEGKIPGANWLCWAQWTWQYREAPWYYSMRNEYLFHGGAVMKFGPEGGAFYGRGSKDYEARQDLAPVASVENVPAGAVEYRSGYLYDDVKAVGARWRYPGMGMVPSSERMWGDPSCVCMGSRLSVDAYGRVFVPNVFRFAVDILDTDGNRLGRVGRYGNADDQGPDVFFAWPAFLSAAGDKLYVSDPVNGRVSVVRFDWAAESAAELK